MSDISDNHSTLTPPTRLFSLQGRLGRARYVARCMIAIVLAFMFIYGAGWGLLFSTPAARIFYVVISVLLFYVVLPIFFAMQTVQRAHDFNMGGWLALLMLVPVINLLFWFVPGTRSDNAYGPPPAKDPLLIKLVAVALPLLMVAGFLATAEVHHEGPGTDGPIMDPHHKPLQPYTP